MGNYGSKPATLTEKNCPDLTGKVYIVTGASSLKGCGGQLAQILYSKNAKVYLASRSTERNEEIMSIIKANHPDSKGTMENLFLDLADLTTIKKSADEFLAKEQRLDVLFNNAGVMMCPQGSKTTQGYELQLGTNNVGTFLFTKLLTPILISTAATAPKDSVRVVWVSSTAAALLSPKGGVVMDNLDYKRDQNPQHKYGVSKAGNFLHAAEYARRFGKDGVISVATNPGNLGTDLYRHIPRIAQVVVKAALAAPIYGAYSELWAGLTPEIKAENNGCFTVPFGAIGKTRADVHQSAKTTEEGGTGVGKEFWEWTEKQVEPYC